MSYSKALELLWEIIGGSVTLERKEFENLNFRYNDILRSLDEGPKSYWSLARDNCMSYFTGRTIGAIYDIKPDVSVLLPAIKFYRLQKSIEEGKDIYECFTGL